MGILQLGFKNVYEGDKAVGFQVKIRNTSHYMGVYASLIESFGVTVDDESFSGEQITCTFGTTTLTQDKFNGSRVHWDYQSPATLTVSKPGGLKPGVHNVGVNFTLRVYHNLISKGLKGDYKAKIAIV
jgi:hypothetical protein